MSEASPWADPDSPAGPYAGPPPTDRPAPPPYGAVPYGAVPYGAVPYGYPSPGYPPYGYPPYGYPAPWPPVPPGPKRPGQVIAAAVLAFVQGGLVLLSSLYVVFFASIVDIAVSTDPSGPPPEEVAGLATEGTVVGFVQVASAVLLIVGGVMALNSRRRRALVVLATAFAVQVLLCLYWAVRLSMLADDLPGADPTSAFLAFTLLFLAGPAVGLGLALLGPGRRWFDPAPTTP